MLRPDTISEAPERLRIWYKNPISDTWGRKGAWVEIPEGPHPITREQLDRARELYRKRQRELADRFPGVAVISGRGHPVAGQVLREVVPKLSDFDILLLRPAVLIDKIKTEVA